MAADEQELDIIELRLDVNDMIENLFDRDRSIPFAVDRRDRNNISVSVEMGGLYNII